MASNVPRRDWVTLEAMQLFSICEVVGPTQAEWPGESDASRRPARRLVSLKWASLGSLLETTLKCESPK